MNLPKLHYSPLICLYLSSNYSFDMIPRTYSKSFDNDWFLNFAKRSSILSKSISEQFLNLFNYRVHYFLTHPITMVLPNSFLRNAFHATLIFFCVKILYQIEMYAILIAPPSAPFFVRVLVPCVNVFTSNLISVCQS